MSETEPLDGDSSLEAYLDGRLSPPERSDFVQQLRQDAPLRAQVELQGRIDESLRRLFPLPAAGSDHVHQMAAGLAGTADFGSKSSRFWARWVALTAAAALVGGVLFLLLPEISSRPQPHFSPAPLAQLYREAVRNGFEPYYECRDDARFASVFSERQGIALRLLPMPEDRRMLGLSYPGGLSRNTTAMLCEVDEQPVMVFVDRLDEDQPTAGAAAGSDLYVHRTARDGLVFYEVTPFDGPRVLPYLVP